MTDAAVVGRLLDEYHERWVAPSAIRVLAGSEHQARVTYRVTLPDGSTQIIRAFRADEPLPVHAQDAGGENVAAWLLGRARTLALLADAAYPAPRPVRTRTGELIGVAGPWLSWATTFTDGPMVEPSLQQLRLIGAALGHLHAVAALPGGDRIGDGPPGVSSRHPAIAVPACMARLEAVAARVPARWRSMHASFRDALARIGTAAGSLPETIVHGDVWARNVVQPFASRVTFIDWETGGRGLAVLDLGNALLECHLDSALPDDQPDRWLITPSAARVAAIAGGYASVRPLPAGQVDLLPAAVTFSTAVVGSAHFEQALLGGVSGPAMDARFARLANRHTVAAEVAALARPYLTG